MRLTKLSIIIPVYNEAATVLEILNKIKSVQLIHNIKKEFVIVDDGSQDASKQLVHHFINENPTLDIQYHEHEENQGKGASIQTGISNATGEFLIIQDADLEYNPAEYNVLLQPILDDVADVVYGSRFLKKEKKRTSYFWHYNANKFLTFLSNIFSGLKLTDMETCYKLLNSEIVKKIQLSEKRFGFEPEVTAKLARIKGIRVKEVSISYESRRYNEGKKIGWKDGVRAIYCIVKYGLFRMN
ncbi:glycosyltransferase involved in cell wall biosynthesis [Kordia periserrulae]|uniref:Glycosyltransferase involved in cell wall biosynthesis n=1 Tax=Kordia periserrulae TaxID=701523 RepID=A0A2T6C2T6_9FLAO|nr:glycosyltransferase family 2 protein [Kordia periserrulae]PTX62636.1 glycosyltransferase involved in cell wall biosynthesis [Kordia periserrulae]